MGILNKIGGWIMDNIISKFTKTAYGVDNVSSSTMQSAINGWLQIYRANPPWLNNDIDTINFAKTISEETARLTCLDIGIQTSGRRGEYMQEQIDKTIMPRIQSWTEYGMASGTVIFKPNGQGVDIITPDRFVITSYDTNKNITGVIFMDKYRDNYKFYTKLEYQKLEKDNTYMIQNKAFVSMSEAGLGTPIDLQYTKWADLEPEVHITAEELKGMLFGVFTTPTANNIDFDSPMGMAIFSESIKELQGLDVAYTRLYDEIYDSQDISLIDERLLHSPGEKIGTSKSKLPRYVKNIFGMSSDDAVQNIERKLKTSERKEGINQMLSLIGTKCGYGPNYFTMDTRTGLPTTAREIESGDRKTIDLIKSCRDNLKIAINQTLYAISIFADLYDLAPVGDYTVDYNFGDLTYSADEDRARCYELTQSGYLPKWVYLVKWEGYSEEEAKKMIEEAEGTETSIFPVEE